MRAEQPYNQKKLFHFTYNIQTRIVEQEQDLVDTYDLERFYHNMPYGFSDSNVIPEDREEYNDMYRRLDAGAHFATADFRVSSDLHWARVTMYQESPGSPIFQGIVQDVSERYHYVIQQARQQKLAQARLKHKEMEALQLLRAISETYDLIISVNLTQDYYNMIDAESFITAESANGVFSEVIAYHASLVAQSHQKLYLNTFTREALIKAYKDGKKSIYLEYQQLGDDGQLHWLATHTMFVDNPYSDDIMEITIIKNIDERIRKEQENQLILRDALLVAEKANAAKSDFLSRMSHDIRTPMNAIIGMTTIAAAQIDDREKVKDCLVKIGVSSKFLLNLVNDILDLAKIESGKMSLNSHQFSTHEFFNSILTSAFSLTNAKHQKLIYQVDENLSDFYLGDQLRIEQIFLNLLGNAQKFTPEGGQILFTANRIAHSEDTDTLQFTVEDSGIGIAEEFLDKLFEPFSQDSDDHNRKGSGLGLAIVQNLLHLMNGTIRVYSTLGQGSQFVIELPLQRPAQSTAVSDADTLLDDTMHQVAATTNRQLHNKGTSQEILFQGQRILLVEDNEFNQEVAKTILEMHQLQVDVASNGLEALEVFSNSQPGHYLAIFMDIQMPGIDGYEATRRIRRSSHPEAATIPIYAMTANAFARDVSAAKQHGMNGHIAKPVDFDVVAQILLSLLQ